MKKIYYLLFIYLCFISGVQAASVNPVGGTLSTYYYTAKNLSGPSITLGESSNINDNWGTSSPSPISAYNSGDNFSLSYSGYIVVDKNAFFTFYVTSDDGHKLYLDCSNIIPASSGNPNWSTDVAAPTTQAMPSTPINNPWMDQSATTYTYNCSVKLKKGDIIPYKIEFYENGGDATLRLEWMATSSINGGGSVSKAREYVPLGVIGSTVGPGLYYDDKKIPNFNVNSAISSCGVKDQVYVSYNFALNSTSATKTSNYLINGANPSSALLLPDNQTVLLKTSSNLLNSNTISINSVLNSSGKTVNPYSNTFSYTDGVLSNGILGSYYNQNNISGNYFAGTKIDNVDSNINNNWATSKPSYVSAADNFSVAWNGYIKVSTNSNYNLRTTTDDGVKLFIDPTFTTNSSNGANLISAWIPQSATSYTSSTIALTNNIYLPIRMEYYEATGDAVAQLLWKNSSMATYSAIPNANLYYCTPISINNFNINIGATAASTCSDKTITITARDSNNNTLTNYTGTITLTTSTGHGTFKIGTAKGTLSAGSDTGTATYTFVAGDSGVINLALSDTHSEDLTITTSIPSPVISNISSTIQFRDNVFVFTNDAIQVAGKPQAMTSTLKLKDTSTGICANATLYTGNKNLKAWITRDANDTLGIAPTINAISLPNTEPSSSNITLNFTNGVSNFNLNTNDVGAYVLNFKDTSGSFSSTNPIGSSSTIVTKPFALAVSNVFKGAITNPQTTTATGAVFAKAGESFSATVGSYLWNSAIDSNNDGIPDSGATLASIVANGTTPSFKSNVILSSGIPFNPSTPTDSPSGTAVAGTIGGNTILGTSFTNGQATTNNITYNEVGSFTLNAISSNFLGFGSNINSYGNQIVGRFVPAYFTYSVNNPIFTTNNGAFNFLGKPFSYSTNPIITISPTSLSGAILSNYVGSYARTNNSNISTPIYTSSSGVIDSSGISASSLTLNANGTMTITLNSGTGLIMQKGSLVAPFSPDIAASFTLTDLDNVTSQTSPITIATTTSGNGIPFNVSKEFRFGRLNVSPSYGNELSLLPIYVESQYWNGLGFITNTLDNTTTINNNNVAVGNYLGVTNGSVVVSNGGTLNSGKRTLYAKANGVSKIGSVDVALNLTNTTNDNSCIIWSPTVTSNGSNQNYLSYNWCGSIKSPNAKLGFGFYKNTNKMIYIRDN